MKTLLVLLLLISSLSWGKDLTGTQLICDSYSETANGLDFLDEKNGIYYQILNEKEWELKSCNFKYEVRPNYISFDGDCYVPSLNRKSLKLNKTWQCFYKKNKIEMKDFLQEFMEHLIYMTNNKNKI